MAGFTAFAGGVGAETALPFPAANFRASAKVGGFSVEVAAAIRAFLRVRRFGGGVAFFTVCKCFGVRFQPLGVQCKPAFLKPSAVMVPSLLAGYSANLMPFKQEIQGFNAQILHRDSGLCGQNLELCEGFGVEIIGHNLFALSAALP